MASSASSNQAALTELQEELVFQRVYLMSLQEQPETPEVRRDIAQIRIKIKDIKDRLARLPRSPAVQNTSSQASSSQTDMSNPYRTTPGGAPSPADFSRKRPFQSSYLDPGAPGPSANKSQRTTPSPDRSGLNTPSSGFGSRQSDDSVPFIDLTGDEDLAAVLARYNEEEERYRRTKAQADQDEIVARQLSAPGGGSGGVVVPQTTSYLSNTATGPLPPPRPTVNAFDRMLSRAPVSSTPTFSAVPVQQQLGSTAFGAPAATPQNQAAFLEEYEVPDAFPGPSLFNDDEDMFAFQYSLSPQVASNGGSSVYGNGAGPSSTSFFDTDASSSTPAFDFDRPGFITNGTPAYANFTPASQVLQSSSSSIPSTLSSIGGTFRDLIDKTQNYLFGDVVNQPNYNPRLARIFSDYETDQSDTKEEIQKLLANIKPEVDLSDAERSQTPDALKGTLYKHQQIALKWMKDQEEGSNKGGILADDMGLGKTISTLAVIVDRPSTEGVKTNLIVGPVALIRQWGSEVHSKLKPGRRLRVFLYHGTKKASYDELRRYDVVLTTYGTLAAEYKRYHHHLDSMADVGGYDFMTDSELHKKCPFLHPKSEFYRVILDESQCIKNPQTQSSKAADKLIAKYRWCLTGTPMMNGVHELYPLIKFLKIKPYCFQRQFQDAFASLTTNNRRGQSDRRWSPHDRSEAMQKLRVLLKAIMLRRLKSSMIDGKPILDLPPKTEEQLEVPFTEDEKTYYDTLEQSSQVQFSKYLRAGTVGKHYSNILVLLLRLRQACCHPHLNMDFENATADPAAEGDMIKLAKELLPPVIQRIKEKDAFECPICYDVAINPRLAIPCGHDFCFDCFNTLSERSVHRGIRDGQENTRAKCPNCREPVDVNKSITLEIFKQVHMPETLPDNQGRPDEMPDEEELDEYESDSEAEEDGDEEARKLRKIAKLLNPRKKGKGKNKDEEEISPHMLQQLRKDSGKNKEARRKYMKYLKKYWEDSAKVTKVIELLMEIQQSGEKTIVFSQWTALLDLIEVPLKQKLGPTSFVRYDGGMTMAQRDDAVTKFTNGDHTTVMLCSLRAGNAGLNLTQASRVIICDPFWNPYIEMQAVDRAHRIGQQRPVQVHRILVKGTIEDRIMQLQENKRALVEAALDENESKSLGRLSSAELGFLFGVQGRPYRR